MKYSKDLLQHVEEYCSRLGLDNRLVHTARTNIQADALHRIQFECQDIHRPFYEDRKAKDAHEPKREQKKADKYIDDLLKHLYDYHMPSEIEMIAHLQALQARFDIKQRVLKPNQVLNGVMEDIQEELQTVGFSDTNIKENLLPIFTAMIKSE